MIATEMCHQSLSITDLSFEKNNVNGVILYHYAKAINLLDATLRLCAEGYAREAIPVSRSLFNIFINLRWITSGQDIEKRIEKFTDFEVLTKANNAKTLIDYEDSLTEKEKDELRKVHQEEIEWVVNKYGLEDKVGKKFPNWSMSIADMAIDVGLEKDYRITYGRLSQTEHSDPESATEYLEGGDNDAIELKLGPSEEYVVIVMIDSTRYFLNIKRDSAEILGFQFNQDKVSKLGELQQKYESVFCT